MECPGTAGVHPTMNEIPGRRVRLTTAALITTIALLVAPGFLPFSAAGSLANPEIQDEVGDVSPGSFAVNNPAHSSLFASANISAYDLRGAYILLETHDDVYLRFLVRDLPDDFGPPANGVPQGLVGPNATQPFVVLLAFFQAKGQSYMANASLALVEGQSIVDRYTLHRGNDWIELQGAYNVIDNSVTLRIPKDLIGNPTKGDRMTDFRAEGRFGNFQMDFAPNARDVSASPSPAPTDVLQILLHLANGGTQLVEPTFGRSYDFGNFRDPFGAVHLSASPSSRAVAPGGSVRYDVEVSNGADFTDIVLLTLVSASAGWSHSLSLSEVTIAPHSSQVIVVTVHAPQAAQGALVSRITAVGSAGATDALALVTNVAQGSATNPTSTPASNASGHDRPGDGADDGASPHPKKRQKKATPGFEMAALAASLGAVAWAARRRRS